ncbi:MAG: PDZ domain-containing protein [Clostridia bacterium]
MNLSRFRPGRRTLIALAVAAASLVVLWLIPTEYMISAPGSAQDVAGMISVDGKHIDLDENGSLMLTTVISDEANALLYIVGRLYPLADLNPKSAYLRSGEDFDDYLQRTRQMMRESQEMAKYVAFDQLGYDVSFEGEGVLVVDVRKDSLALDVLQPGDVMVSADGRPTEIVDHLLDIVGEHRPGDEIDLEFLRGEGDDRERRRSRVTLIESPEEDGAAIIGIGVTTENPSFGFPRDVEIDAGSIGGPSAGLAFTLAVVDALTPEEALIDDHRLACTGMVNVRGEVGAVGGVHLKAHAARRAGAEYFLVPEANYADAKRADVDLEIVPVATVEEALDFLRGLRVP